MSWSLNKTGRAGALAVAIRTVFENTGGCPKGSAEETAKNAIGAVCEELCNSLPTDKVISIEANGSAWNSAPGALSQSVMFKFTTHGEFVE